MPKKREAPSEPAKPEKQAKKREGPISLYPLTFEEAVRGLLQVKMEPEDTAPRRRPTGGVRKPS